MNESAPIYAHCVSRSFSSTRVLTNVSLTIEAGSVYGLVGLNGAGKTTLIRILCGLLKPDTGIATINGLNTWNHAASMYQTLGMMLDHDGFFGNLTFAQNMQFYAAAKHISTHDLHMYLDEFWSECDIVTSPQKVSTFSRGQKVQCAVCRAFLGWPQVAIFDEPTVALDIEAYTQFTKLVRSSQKRGSAILLSSHQLETIETLCDRIGVLRGGQLSELSQPGSLKDIWNLTLEGLNVIPILLQWGSLLTPPENNCYTIKLNNPETTSADLVKALVSCGIKVYEVHPRETSLRSRISKALPNA